jgi:oxidase EvaA
MSIINTVQELKKFIKEVDETIQQKITSIPFSKQEAWGIKDDVLTHKTKGFFYVTGIESLDNNLEQHLMLYQPQSALTGLLLCKKNNRTYILLQARTEPGNVNFIQFGPTVQSTAANYLKLHGGKATSYIDYFLHYNPDSNLITHSIQHDLGKRYYQKSKTHHYVEVQELLACDSHMAWVSKESIFEILETDNLVNPDLRSLLSVFDWDHFHNNLQPEEIDITSCLRKTSVNIKRSKHKLVSLDQLDHWKISDTEISTECQKLPSVKMFHCIGESREVREWFQPLICVNGEGLSQLLFREIKGEIEYLITVDHEVGISTNFAMYPTNNFYAEDDSSEYKVINGELHCEFIQCDEGGRFFQNNIKYQVYKVNNDYPVEKNQIWVTKKGLKEILATSNIASLQLRCISSSIIDQLNPASFKRKS